MRRVMITGGLGFIGTNLVKHWLAKHPADRVIVVDAGTYAANDEVYELEDRRLAVESLDIRDQAMVARAIRRHRPHIMLHLAAESHVCRSIAGPKDFVTTNILGTWNLLEEWRMYLQDCAGEQDMPFVYVSTDEVFGEIAEGQFNEDSPIKPRSPYAASKAAGDLLAMAYFETYEMPIRITNCSNNFGPWQHPEKLIPATIQRILKGDPVRIYGDGQQVRDWLWVGDHCRAIEAVALKGANGERYAIGGGNEKTNWEMVQKIFEIMSANNWASGSLNYELVDARPKDDRRYAIDGSKISYELGWDPGDDFEERLLETILWYVEEMAQNELQSCV